MGFWEQRFTVHSKEVHSIEVFFVLYRSYLYVSCPEWSTLGKSISSLFLMMLGEYGEYFECKFSSAGFS